MASVRCTCKKRFVTGQIVESAHIGGVQTLMRQQYPFAYFVHCAAHRLNLVKPYHQFPLLRYFLPMLVILVHFQLAAHIEKLSLCQQHRDPQSR
jgi:hypothetical protein